MSGLVWGLSALVEALPEAVLRPVSVVLGWLWWDVIRFRRSTILENLSYAFSSWPYASKVALGKEVARHLSQTLLEVLRLRRYARSDFDNVEVLGLGALERALQEGRGVLVLSGHLGSFELAMAAGACRAPAPVSVVVKRLPGAFGAWVARARAAAGLSAIDARSSVTAVCDALHRNEIVVFVLDQNATRRIGVFVEFFGRSACTMRALAAVALRTGAPVLCAIPRRTTDGHQLEFGSSIPFESQGAMRRSIRHMTQVYTEHLERAIRATPVQWFWAHRRFKTQPRSTIAPISTRVRSGEGA